MLTIRLQRVGRTNQAAFRIVLAEKHRAASKKVVEVLGHYDPRTKEFGLKDPERLKYWVAQHVELSPTAHNLLVTKGLVEGKKVKAWRPKPKPAEAADSAIVATTAGSAEAGVKAKEEVKAETKPVGAEAKAPEAKAEPAPAAPTAEAPKEEPKAEKSEEAKPAA